MTIDVNNDNRHGDRREHSWTPCIGRSGSEVAATGLLLAAATAAAVGVLTLVRTLWTAGAALPVTLAENARPAALDRLPEGITTTRVHETVELVVDSLPVGLRLLAAAGPALLLLSVAVGAWLLAGVVRSVGRGRPFDRRNPRQLAGLAVAIVVGGLVSPILRDVASTAVLEAENLVEFGSPFVIAGTISFLPVMLAVLLLTVAEAFRRGGALEDEVEEPLDPQERPGAVDPVQHPDGGLRRPGLPAGRPARGRAARLTISPRPTRPSAGCSPPPRRCPPRAVPRRRGRRPAAGRSRRT